MVRSKEHQPENIIPIPNIHNLNSLEDWLNNYIHTPLTSFADSPYSAAEGIRATRQQYYRWVRDFLNDPVALEKISEMLMRRASPKIPTKT